MRLLAFERRALLVIFDTMLPPGAHPRLPLGARDIPLEDFFDDAERHAPFDFLIGLRAALWIIWLCPIFAIGRLRTFRGLGDDDRLRVLRWLQRHRLYGLREMPGIAKTVACLAYAGLPRIQAAIGIDRIDATPPEWASRTSPALFAARDPGLAQASPPSEGSR